MAAASTIAPARPVSVPSGRIDPAIVEADASPAQGTSQCMQALARANEVRLARAAMKRDVAAGRLSVTAVLAETPWEARSMSLSELLCSQRRWGRARSRKLLASAGLSEAKRVGTLTPRQRRILVGALEAKLALRPI